MGFNDLQDYRRRFSSESRIIADDTDFADFKSLCSDLIPAGRQVYEKRFGKIS